MPRQDDQSVSDTSILIRGIRPNWVTTSEGEERLTSATFADGLLEASCFIAEEVGGLEGFNKLILPKLEQRLEISLRVATVSAARVREKGLWIYRKPDEFDGNPAHVVVCPPDGVSKSQYRARTRKLTDDAKLLPAFNT